MRGRGREEKKIGREEKRREEVGGEKIREEEMRGRGREEERREEVGGEKR